MNEKKINEKGVWKFVVFFFYPFFFLNWSTIILKAEWEKKGIQFLKVNEKGEKKGA